MKKIGLICLAIVLALGGLGVGLAMWSETLTIDATVNTGDINPGMHLAPNSIGAAFLQNPTSPLPVIGGTDDGIWDSAGQNDLDWDTSVPGPIINDWLADPWQCPQPWVSDPPGTLLEKDVGSTSVTMSDDLGSYTSNLDGNVYTLSRTMTITINKAYPDYVSGVSFCVANSGTVPIHLSGLKAVGVPPELEVVMLDYPVDPLPGGQGTVPGYDWGITFLTDNTEYPIPFANRWQLDAGESWLTGIGIHCLQSAEQGATYTFTIEVWAQQWNEP